MSSEGKGETDKKDQAIGVKDYEYSNELQNKIDQLYLEREEKIEEITKRGTIPDFDKFRAEDNQRELEIDKLTAELKVYLLKQIKENPTPAQKILERLLNTAKQMYNY